ncbi:MAG: hypothetical protein KGZ70_13580 [Hydrogenophaga sp.]|nr:hypothetical protein [Hydrogenophaga sp.]
MSATPPGTVTLYGRRFSLLADFPNTPNGAALANAFMQSCDKASVLKVSDRICLADKDDLGTPA